jgi:hypothetical protein
MMLNKNKTMPRVNSNERLGGRGLGGGTWALVGHSSSRSTQAESSAPGPVSMTVQIYYVPYKKNVEHLENRCREECI